VGEKISGVLSHEKDREEGNPVQTWADMPENGREPALCLNLKKGGKIEIDSERAKSYIQKKITVPRSNRT